jgi:hypothetical protein
MPDNKTVAFLANKYFVNFIHHSIQLIPCQSQSGQHDATPI